MSFFPAPNLPFYSYFFLSQIIYLIPHRTGLNFLAAEIGEDTTGLPQIGRDIAAGVGYQRLALQLLGALKAPIKKGKEPMSWEEIHTLVMDLRSELGLRKKDG